MTDHNDLADTTFAAPATYGDFWATVLGPDRNAADVVREFDLAGSTLRDLDEWLGTAESEAWSAGRLEGEIRADFHQRALHTLEAAATIYVVWGAGAATADVSGDATLQPYTPWAGRDLVGEEWVGSFMGAAFDLESDPNVAGYRALAEHELREWRSV